MSEEERVRKKRVREKKEKKKEGCVKIRNWMDYWRKK
jgi:hypothetical protein